MPSMGRRLSVVCPGRPRRCGTPEYCVCVAGPLFGDLTCTLTSLRSCSLSRSSPSWPVPVNPTPQRRRLNRTPERRQPTAALAWLLALFALPALGGLLWWAFGRTHLERKRRRRARMSLEFNRKKDGPMAPPSTVFDRVVPRRAVGTHAAGPRVRAGKPPAGRPAPRCPQRHPVPAGRPGRGPVVARHSREHPRERVPLTHPLLWTRDQVVDDVRQFGAQQCHLIGHAGQVVEQRAVEDAVQHRVRDRR